MFLRASYQEIFKDFAFYLNKDKSKMNMRSIWIFIYWLYSYVALPTVFYTLAKRDGSCGQIQ